MDDHDHDVLGSEREFAHVRTLLTRVADAGGDFRPPAPAALVHRRPRLVRTRSGVAVLVSAVAIGAVAVLVFGLMGPRSALDARLKAPVDTGRTQQSHQPVVTAADLADYRWGILPAAPINTRSDSAAVWTGQQMLVWGGQDLHNVLYADGAAYDPATRTWTRLPEAPLTARADPQGVWVGGYFVVWGGTDGTGSLTDGARYDPRTRTWTSLPGLAGVPQRDVLAQLVVVGQQAVLFTATSSGLSIGVHRYDPRTNSWHFLPPLDQAPTHGIFDLSALTIGARIMVWVEWSHNTTIAVTANRVTTGTSYGVDARQLDPSRGRWTPAAFTPDQGLAIRNALWTGSRILLPDQGYYCGPCPGPFRLGGPGQSIDPASGAHSAFAASPVNAGGSAYVWTGGAILAIDLETEFGHAIVPGQAAVWDAGSNSWARAPDAPIRYGTSGTTNVWTGSRWIIWGLQQPLSTGKAPPQAAGFEFAPAGSS